VANAASPLEGIRVLDFSHVLAGPICTRVLADLGADVLRVESSKHSDSPWRSASDEALDRTLAYVMVHRGKRSITIDLKSETGNALARRLASVADVIVENFSAGVMRRLGLDYASLHERNPRLVFVSMSGYGHDGPRRAWTSMNSNLQAYSGLMMATEAEDQAPVAISNSWMDYIGGLHGCFAVLDRLTERESTGLGAHVDLSQFECGVASLGPLLLSGIVDGTLPPRVGNRSSRAVPQNCYRCAGEDQWCVVSVENDEQWRALGAALGNPPWTGDPRFASVIGRLQHHDEIDRAIETWTSALASDEVERRLDAAGVPASRMRRMDDILDRPDPQSVFRFVTGGKQPTLLTGLPFAFEPGVEQTFGPAPRLGENTDDGLRDWLALDRDEIAQLHGSGALV
jgi:benzylsuccinate CoA-transferase BbsF subunit